MVELRKRKAPAEAAPARPAKKSTPKPSANKGKQAASTNGASSSQAVAVGNTIDLERFGGEIETNDGEKTTLKKLVDESKGGVVLFTYPKASTPGCTNQACLFRDEFKPLTATGFSIYGLSRDSPKSNSAFKNRQKLPYTLLCDPQATLISAIGMKKAPSGTTRGVFVVDKQGKVLAAEPGGPGNTVAVVRELVGGTGEAGAAAEAGDGAEESKVEKEIEEGKPVLNEAEQSTGVNGTAEQKDDAAEADVAADVADTAEKLGDTMPAAA